jgi:hypothetical protein
MTLLQNRLLFLGNLKFKVYETNPTLWKNLETSSAMRFQQFSGKNSKELTTAPFMGILRTKVSTFPVAVVNF